MGADYEVFLVRSGRTSVAKARDISPTGIGIFTNEQLEPGEEVEIKILMPRESLNLWLKAVVRNCGVNNEVSAPDYAWVAGIEFTEDVTNADVPLIGPGKVSSYSASHSLSIKAPANYCYGLLCNFERYPEWARELHQVRVLERRGDGRGRLVEFEISLLVRKLNYVLDYSYNDDELCLSWDSAGGDLLSITGRYFFRPVGENCASATYEITASMEFALSERFFQYLSRIVMRRTMKDFRTFVEQNYKMKKDAETLR